MDVWKRNKCFSLIVLLIKLEVKVSEKLSFDLMSENNWISGLEEEFQGFQRARDLMIEDKQTY